MPRCPCCDTEVELGAPSCPDCGLALSGLDESASVPAAGVFSSGSDGAPVWPSDSEGQPVTPVLLCMVPTPSDCAVTESLLHGCGIPTLTRTPLPNQFSPVIFGGPILGADLFVPESRLAEARSLLHESRM